jgi:single-stranded-DNA-specific exonuclease
MKYKLINEDIKNKNLLDIVYENRDITKGMVEKLLGANSEDYRSPFEIKNMESAVTFFQKVIKKEGLVVGILVDEDVDGFTSSAVLYQWLKDDVKIPIENIKVFMHKQAKQHGLYSKVFPDMLNSDVDLFIVADSSSNDLEQQEQLLSSNKQLIILDHHLYEHDNFVEGIYLVNNQLEQNESSALAGVGVVAKFIEANGCSIDKYTDLIAVGLVADAMDMTNIQNKAYVNEGLSNLNNELIKEFFKEIKNPVGTNISWDCANFMNSVIRYGAKEEKELLWKAITNQEGTVEYKNKKGEVVEQTLQEAFKRIANNVKSRQNSAIKKAVKKVEEYIHKNKLEKNKVIIVTNDNLLEHSITGITAQRLVNEYKRPIIIVSPYMGEYSGSVRSPFNFKEMLDESGLVTFAQGHSQAFGVGFPKENIPKLVEHFNEKLRYYEVEEKVYDVDYVFNGKDLKLDDVKEIANMSKLWGMSIEEPTFIVKNISIESIKISYKKEGICYVTQFTYNGVCFKKVFSSKKVFEEITRVDLLKFGRSQLLDICVLVKFKKNEKGFYYAEIQDFNSNKSNKVVF